MKVRQRSDHAARWWQFSWGGWWGGVVVGVVGWWGGGWWGGGVVVGVVGWWVVGGGVGHWGVNRNEKKALHVLKIDQLTSRAYSNNQTLRIQQTTKRAYELAGHLCIPANALYTNTAD